MVEQRFFTDDDFPAALKCQVLSFQRIVWWEGFAGELRLRDWIHQKDSHPVHFVIFEQHVLICYAGVVWKHLQHAGEAYKTYGLTGVLTYPAFRRQGYGRRIVDAATAYILRSDADLALFTCNPSRRDFYSASGWSRWIRSHCSVAHATTLIRPTNL